MHCGNVTVAYSKELTQVAGEKDGGPINHIILNCTQLEDDRNTLRNAIVRTGEIWPPSFEQFTRKHIKTFTKFVKSIDISALCRLLNTFILKIKILARKLIGPLAPSDPYMGRTAQLTSRR
jgi:hypothetical protein